MFTTQILTAAGITGDNVEQLFRQQLINAVMGLDEAGMPEPLTELESDDDEAVIPAPPVPTPLPGLTSENLKRKASK